jgi:preprotein translocase subunit SecG
MSTLVTVIHVVVCIFLMLTVLLQAGKGGGMGAAFGGGSSQGTVFGGSGAGGFLRKLTIMAAAGFMITSMTLAYISSNTGADSLRRYDAQQRRERQLKEQAEKDALDTVKKGGAVIPEGATDGTSTPEGETPATETPEGAPAEGTETPAEGTETPAEGTEPPAEGDAPKTDAPKTDAPKTDAPKTDAPKPDAPKTDEPAAPTGGAPATP